MNIVVIGGAGFVGSHLVDRLLAEGHTVDVVDDLSTGSLGNLADARTSGGSLKIHHLDAASAQGASLINLRRPDVVYNLALFPRRDRTAAAYGPGSNAGLAGTVSMLEACRDAGVGKVVIALPASALYGTPAWSALPAKETSIEGRGVRGVVAKSVIDLLTLYRDHASLEFTALALASVYGSRQHPAAGVVAAFQHAADAGEAPVFYGDGRHTRDFVFIDDTVDAFVRAADRSSGLVINIGTGEQTSLDDLWELIGGADREKPVDGPPRPAELTRFAVSPVRARIHLGWAPWTDLRTGLATLA